MVLGQRGRVRVARLPTGVECERGGAGQERALRKGGKGLQGPRNRVNKNLPGRKSLDGSAGGEIRSFGVLTGDLKFGDRDYG